MNFHMTNLVANGRFLKVEGVDYNGKTFDGPPLVTVTLDGYPNQPVDGEFVKTTNVKHIETRGCTDYAWFGVVDDYDNVTWAGPGDYLYQVEPQGKTFVVIPAKAMELLLN